MLESENTFGTVDIYCDGKGCDKSYYHDEPMMDSYPDPKEACKMAKEEGWIILKEDGEWYHYCSKECKEKDDN